MKSEILLYGYSLVCLSMLAFNLVYLAVHRRGSLRSEGQVRRMSGQIGAQLDRIRRGAAADPRHLRRLRRRLGRVSGLAAFDAAMEECAAGGDPALETYQFQIQPVIFDLTVAYRRRDDMQAAYFAYFLSRYKCKRRMPIDAIQDVLVDYMRRNSLYCRVNALEALYHFGCVESIVKAVVLLDREGSFIHEKVLTDGLLSFTGDHRRLIGLLWAQMDRLSVKTQLSILNYIRFQSGDFCREMLPYLAGPARDKELCLSVIRYFGRYPYSPALPHLLRYAADSDPLHWEYAAVSASALARYPAQDAAAVLMEAAHSGNWHVRANAAASLEALRLDYRQLVPVAGGRDRYAREMLMYRLERRRMAEQSGAAVS